MDRLIIREPEPKTGAKERKVVTSTKKMTSHIWMVTGTYSVLAVKTGLVPLARLYRKGQD